ENLVGGLLIACRPVLYSAAHRLGHQVQVVQHRLPGECPALHRSWEVPLMTPRASVWQRPRQWGGVGLSSGSSARGGTSRAWMVNTYRCSRSPGGGPAPS